MKRADQGITAVDAEGPTSIEYALFSGYLNQILPDSMDKISLPHM